MHQKKDMKKLMVFLVSLIMLITMMPVITMAQISDLEGHWAGSVIADWLKQGQVSGYSDNRFRPDHPITRAEFMLLTNNAFGFKEQAAISFNDVQDSDWFAGAVKQALQAGYLSGFPNGEIRPNNAITRQEAAVVLTKIMRLTANPERTEQFTDFRQIPEWSCGYIGAIAEAGYMNGYPDGSFRPTASITRAEAVVALDNVLKAVAPKVVQIYDQAGTYGPAQGVEIIETDVIVKTDGVTLQNLNVEGNLIVAEEVGAGTVILNNLTVKGETFFRGGGKDSIHINGGKYNKITIQKTLSGELRVVATNAAGVELVVAQEAAGDTVILEGTFESVQVEAEGVEIQTQEKTVINQLLVAPGAENSKLDLNPTTTVEKLVLEATTEVKGQGTVNQAEIKANHVTFEKAPAKQTVAETVTTPPATTSTPTTGGGGGGGGGGSTLPQTVTPTASPAAGPVAWGSPITLATTTSEAAIYYTVDGSTPTTASLLYSAPITITKNTTVKAIAVKAGMTNSSVLTAVYTVVTNPVGKNISFELPEYALGSLPVPTWEAKGTLVEVVNEKAASGNNSLRVGIPPGHTAYAKLPIVADSSLGVVEVSVKINPATYAPGSYQAGYLAFGGLGVMQSSEANWAGWVGFNMQKPYSETIKQEHRVINLFSPNPATWSDLGKVIGYWEPSGYHTITLRWDWREDKFTVTVDLPSGNTVNYEESLHGTTSMSWLRLDGATAPSTNTRHYVWYDDLRLLAGETPPTYALSLTADPAGGGTVTDNTNAGPYTAGSVVNVTAAANAGYEFVNWTVGGAEVSTAASFNYPMPAAATALVANFRLIPPTAYALSLTADPAGGGTVTDNTNAGPYTAGSVVNVTATANAGYEFVNWTVGGAEVSTAASFNYPMPAAATALVANFRLISSTTYAVTVANVVGGTATVTANPTTAAAGNTVTITIASIETGKQFKSISVQDAANNAVNTTTGTAGQQYTFVMPASAVTVTVEVEEISSSADPFTPGEGGNLPSFTPFTPQANSIGGLYVDRSERNNYSFSSGTYSVVDLKFLPPSHYNADSYTLQYSADGTNWQDYQSDSGNLTTSSTDQDNFSLSGPSGDYQYRLLVNGGPKDGYASNVVAAPVSSIDTYFSGWSLDESMWISGTIAPFVGRGLEASFTVQKLEDSSVVDEDYLTYQWYRVNPVTSEMTPVAGATSLTYITTEADAGYKLLIRATGDGLNIGGFVQAMSPGETLLPNKAFATNVTASGFTLNLYRSVNSLSSNDLILRDTNYDPVVITSVTPEGSSSAVFNIEADMAAANGPFSLENTSSFWRITEEMGPGHLMPILSLAN